jgi:hypothetical protein
LLEALCDSLAASGGMQQMTTAFGQPEPLDALKEYLLAFGHFWNVDRLVMRRLRALAALDPDFEQVIRTRDEWRRRGVRVIAERFAVLNSLAPGASLDKTVDILFTLSSFETFDTLAGPTRSVEDVALLVYELVRAALNLAGLLRDLLA